MLFFYNVTFHHFPTFQSYHISLSQIHEVRDRNLFYIFTCYFYDVQLITLFYLLRYNMNVVYNYLSHMI
jgi:hypothetical protein